MLELLRTVFRAPAHAQVPRLVLMLFVLPITVPPLGLKAQDPSKPFLGRWDVTLKTPSREYPSWLEISAEQGQAKVQMVGHWGNARPLPKVEITKGEIEFVSPKEEEYRKDDMVFKGKPVGPRLVGTTTGRDGTPWQWTAVRAPRLDRPAAPAWGEPIVLFDGQDLSTWKVQDPKAGNG